jgi:hypothetical protein
MSSAVVCLFIFSFSTFFSAVVCLFVFSFSTFLFVVVAVINQGSLAAFFRLPLVCLMRRAK